MKIAALLIAKKYAQAFWNTFPQAHKNFPVDMLHDALAYFQANKKLFMLISTNNNPKISCQITDALTKHFNLNFYLKKLLCLLIQHKRLILFPEVIAAILEFHEQSLSIKKFTISSSHPLHDKQKTHIINFVKHVTGALEIQASFHVKPELISGIRIQSHTQLWERSLSKVLKNINLTLLQRVTNV
jgi:ATP synthase F1 delta subunit